MPGRSSGTVRALRRLSIDRQFRLARCWSNDELRPIAGRLHGDVINVSGADDDDKQGRKYASYFTAANSYTISNTGGYRGYRGRPNELLLDLTSDLDSPLHRRFDVVFNHTTLEHIFDVRAAFDTLCSLSSDIVILVVPFSQMQHESESFGDYWRFTPSCLRLMFLRNEMTVLYEAANDHRNAAIYLFFVASRDPERHRQEFPSHRPLDPVGSHIGRSRIRAATTRGLTFVRDRRG